MKQIIYLLLALGPVIFSGSCSLRSDAEEERSAIIAVIEEETAAFVARDFDRLAATYLQDETNVRLTASKTRYVYHVGWDKLASSFRNYFENNPEKEKWIQGRKNYRIKVYEDCAWVIFENEGFLSAGSQSELTGKAVDVRFLEKHKGDWKIVYLSHVYLSSYDQAVENAEVNKEEETEEVSDNSE